MKASTVISIMLIIVNLLAIALHQINKADIAQFTEDGHEARLRDAEGQLSLSSVILKVVAVIDLVAITFLIA